MRPIKPTLRGSHSPRPSALRSPSHRGLARLGLVLLGLIALGSTLGAQTTTDQANLERAARETAQALWQGINPRPSPAQPARVSLGPWVLRGVAPAFVPLWIAHLESALLTQGGTAIQVLSGPTATGAAWRISGDVLQLGNEVSMVSRLMRQSDGVVLANRVSALGVLPIAWLSTGSGGSGDGAASAEGADAWETDSREAPLVVQTGERVAERTLHRADEDWYRWTATDEGLLNVWTLGSMDTYLRVFDADGEELMEDDDGGENGNARLMIPVDGGSTYLIQVTGYDGETGAYVLNLSTQTMSDSLEPNDSRTQATLIEAGEPLESMFIRNGDRDWFRFSLAAESQVSIETTGSLDTWMNLYDSRAMLDEDDDDGDNLNARISRILPAGSYWVEVSNVDEARGPYAIKLAVKAPLAADSFEADDTQGQAKPLTVGGRAQARTFHWKDDQDWMSLNITRAGTYVISLVANLRQGMDSTLTLYDQRMQEVGEDDDGGEDYDPRLEVRLEPGTYYLVAKQIDGEVVGDGAYTIRLEAR